MASAVKWRRRKKWQRPVGTRRQRQAVERYLGRAISAPIFDGLPLMAWLKKTKRSLPAGGGVMEIYPEGTPEFDEAVREFVDAMRKERAG